MTYITKDNIHECTYAKDATGNVVRVRFVELFDKRACFRFLGGHMANTGNHYFGGAEWSFDLDGTNSLGLTLLPPGAPQKAIAARNTRALKKGGA